MNSIHQEIFILAKEDDIGHNTITDAEVVTVHDGIKCISGSYKPALLVFKPEVTVSALSIIICPGGGYEKLALEHEGTAVAESLVRLGITVFVLKYRLPGEQSARNETPLPLKDFISAYIAIQGNASAWGINPASIGTMGFSAGGHLASLASSILSNTQRQQELQDLFPPLFTILIYPVISFRNGVTHIGSRERFLGMDASISDIEQYSSNHTVTPSSPPVFIMHCSDDLVVSVENSLLYYKACLNHNVSAELHVYTKGGHGFGMHNDLINDKWMDRLTNWLLQFM